MAQEQSEKLEDQELKDKLSQLITNGVSYYELTDSFINSGAMQPDFAARWSYDVAEEVDKIHDFILQDRQQHIDQAVREALIKGYDEGVKILAWRIDCSTLISELSGWRGCVNMAKEQALNMKNYRLAQLHEQEKKA